MQDMLSPRKPLYSEYGRLSYFTSKQPDHGKGHVKSPDELEIGAFYQLIGEDKYGGSWESEVLKLDKIDLKNHKILLIRTSSGKPFNSQGNSLIDCGVVPIQSGEFHKTNWLKRVEDPILENRV